MYRFFAYIFILFVCLGSPRAVADDDDVKLDDGTYISKEKLKGLAIRFDVNPRFQDNLKAFKELHEMLKKKEDEVVGLLSLSTVEMDGIEHKGSAYSDYEQFLEKRLNDKRHYIQLGLILVNTIKSASKCVDEFKNYAAFMKWYVVENEGAMLVWLLTNEYIGKELTHIAKLTTSLGLENLISARSTIEEKEALMFQLKKSIEDIQNIITSGRRMAIYGMYNK